METLSFLHNFDEETCHACVGEIEQIDVIDNQITYNSANQTICAASG